MKQKNGLGIRVKGLAERRPDAPLVAAQELSPWGDDSSDSSEEVAPTLDRPKVKFEYHSEEEQIDNSNVIEEPQREVPVVAEDAQAELAAVNDPAGQFEAVVVRRVVENYLADFELLGSPELSESHQYNSKITPNRLNKVTFKQYLVDTYSAVKLHNLNAVKYLAKLVADDMEISVREKLFKKLPTLLNELNKTHIQHISLLVTLCKNHGKICGDELSNFAKQELIAYLIVGDVVAREKADNIAGFDVNQYFMQQNSAAFNALLAVAEQVSKDYKHRIKPAVLKHVALAIQTLGKPQCDVYRAFVAQIFVHSIREKLVAFCQSSKSKEDYNFTNVKKYSDRLRELLQNEPFLPEIKIDDQVPVDEFNF